MNVQQGNEIVNSPSYNVFMLSKIREYTFYNFKIDIVSCWNFYLKKTENVSYEFRRLPVL